MACEGGASVDCSGFCCGLFVWIVLRLCGGWDFDGDVTSVVMTTMMLMEITVTWF